MGSKITKLLVFKKELKQLLEKHNAEISIHEQTIGYGDSIDILKVKIKGQPIKTLAESRGNDIFNIII